MADLQTVFYITAIVYMCLMFLLFIALLTAVLVIKSKINKMHRMVDEKVATAKHISDKVLKLFYTARFFAKR